MQSTPARALTATRTRRLTLALNLFAILPGLCASAQAKPASDSSGHYGSLTLAVRNGVVTGTFYDARGMPDKNGYPPFTCIFMLRGSFHGNTATVQTGIPGEEPWIPGTLHLDGGRASLTLREDQGGCLSTGDSMVATSGDHSWSDSRFDTGEGWLAATLVKKDHAILYPQPQQTPQKRPYLLQYDPVVVLERKAGWTRVEYLRADASGNQHPMQGWMKDEMLYMPEQP